MAVAVKYRDMAEALEEGVRLALDGTPSRESAAVVYAQGLTPDAVAAFAIRGLASYINDRIAVAGRSWAESDEADGDETSSGQPTTARGRQNIVRPHFARERWERILAAKNWEAADGTRKALADFTREDAIFRAGDAEAHSRGWAKVAEAMRLTAALLDKHKADTVSALPTKAKVAIAEAVA